MTHEYSWWNKQKEIIDANNQSDEEDLLVDVRSEKWLSQGSTKEMPAGKYFTQQKSEIKLDTLDDLLNYWWAWNFGRFCLIYDFREFPEMAIQKMAISRKISKIM